MLSSSQAVLRKEPRILLFASICTKTIQVEECWYMLVHYFGGKHPSPLPPSSFPPTPHLHGLPSQTNFAKWVMAATMTMMHDDDADDYEELSSILLTQCQSPKQFVNDYYTTPAGRAVL